ncbi:MAG: hypothetical protein H0X40_03025 [Chthoniobacterales bacterium]|nr:hypothetical protein [Chthoniobacterales bacterium]
MELVAGITFDEALQKLGERSPVGSILNSAEWSRVPVALRERAFFSASVESTRWLQSRLDFLNDNLANTTALNDNGERYFVAGGRAQFIKDAQLDAVRSGLGPLDPNDAGSLKDIRSGTRLALIFDTSIESAYGFGHWKQGQDPDALDAYPAQRLIRVRAVRKPRPYHQAALKDGPRLKSDIAYWVSLNPDFGVPWPPYGWNSGCDVEGVRRAESDRLGLTKPNEVIKPVEKDFNDNLKASTQGLSSRLLDFLRAAFGQQATFEGDSVRWNSEDDDTPSEE